MEDIIQGLKEGTSLNNGTYRIEAVLGSGSFGITYLASTKIIVQGKLGQMKAEVKVAIKEFFMNEMNSRREDGSTVEGSTGNVFVNYRKKFRKEAENLAKLGHAGIVKVSDIFDENNTTYYVMEFLEGSSLEKYIIQKNRIPEAEAIGIIKEVGDALSYMHSRNMLHLDIKPNNIMRTADGKYCLIDFGLSKQFTAKGEPESSTTIGLGTPGYAPLEQASYQKEGTFPATLDVYALGATLFKMLTGKRAPEATYILNDGFPRETLEKAGVSPHTIDVVEKAMAPMKKNRYASVKAFINDLPIQEESEATEFLSGNDEKTIVASVIETPIDNKPAEDQSHISEVNKTTDHFQKEIGEGKHLKTKNRLGLGITIVIVCIILFLLVILPKGSNKTVQADSDTCMYYYEEATVAPAEAEVPAEAEYYAPAEEAAPAEEYYYPDEAVPAEEAK